ncbi:MAG TPA: hypothetical protein VFK88_06490 [Gallionella sp.]|nr:hypothetical protein [Gallionella sp.]
MLTYAVIIFFIGALGGLFLASKVLFNKLAPWPVSIVHALLGAIGIILLITALVEGQQSGRLTAALILFIIAALGGFFLASFHVRQKIAPKAIVIIHASIAVLGFLTLLSLVLGL